MPHSGSLNASIKPRLALIGRWNDQAFGAAPVFFDPTGDSDEFTRTLLSTLGHEMQEGDERLAGWAAVGEETRRHQRYDVARDLFEHWGADVSETRTPRL